MVYWQKAIKNDEKVCGVGVPPRRSLTNSLTHSLTHSLTDCNFGNFGNFKKNRKIAKVVLWNTMNS